MVAFLDQPLPHPEVGTTPMGEMAAEALRAQTGAEVALLDRGSVGGGLEAGEVTLVDILRIHPWRGRVLRLSLNGARLRTALEEDDLLAAGCTFRRTEQGLEDLRVAGAPVEVERTYTVAVGEYATAVAPSLGAVPAADTGERIDTVLREYLAQAALVPAGD